LNQHLRDDAARAVHRVDPAVDEQQRRRRLAGEGGDVETAQHESGAATKKLSTGKYVSHSQSRVNDESDTDHSRVKTSRRRVRTRDRLALTRPRVVSTRFDYGALRSSVIRASSC